MADKSNALILNCCTLGDRELEFWNSLFDVFEEQYRFHFFSSTPTDGLAADECIRVAYNLATYSEIPEDLPKQFDQLIQQVAEKDTIWEKYSESSSKKLAYSWLVYWILAVRWLKPVTAILWNGHHIPEAALQEICDLEGVDVVFAERGPLAGTFALDQQGINFQSSFASNFSQIQPKASAGNVKRFAELYLKTGRSNWSQPARYQNKRDFLADLDVPEGRKVVFFPTQLDRDVNSKLFSPHFPDTFAAFEAVANWCNSHSDEIYLLTKKHPLQEKSEAFEGVHLESGRFVKDVHIFDCIEYCDGVISINSSVAIEAALLGKPVALIGQSILQLADNALCLQDASDLDAMLSALVAKIENEESAVDENFFSKLLFGYLYSGSQEYLELGLRPLSDFGFADNKVGQDGSSCFLPSIDPLLPLTPSADSAVAQVASLTRRVANLQREKADLERLSAKLQGDFLIKVLRKLRLIRA